MTTAARSLKVHIQVTSEDIAAGKPCSSGFCPIALAAARVGLLKPIVGRLLLGREGLADEKFASMPVVARDFIERFDNEEPVEPFEFTVSLPADALAAR